MNRDLEIGQKVRFVNFYSRWYVSKNNPLDCKGTVTEIDGVIYVEWENGGWNSYLLEDHDLELVN